MKLFLTSQTKLSPQLQDAEVQLWAPGTLNKSLASVWIPLSFQVVIINNYVK